jgi:hypothetical protein
LQAIFAMSAEEMAATSAFTRRAYEAQIAQIYRIQNKQIRDVVLELVRNPAATAFGQKSSQPWLASPGSGWKSHHAYPGGSPSIRWSGWRSPTAGSMPTTASMA